MNKVIMNGLRNLTSVGTGVFSIVMGVIYMWDKNNNITNGRIFIILGIIIIIIALIKKLIINSKQ